MLFTLIFNLDQFIRYRSNYNVNDINLNNFMLGKFEIIQVIVNTMHIQSHVNRACKKSSLIIVKLILSTIFYLVSKET